MPEAAGRCLAVAEQTGQHSLSQGSQAAIHSLRSPGQSTSCPSLSTGRLLVGHSVHEQGLGAAERARMLPEIRSALPVSTTGGLSIS